MPKLIFSPPLLSSDSNLSNQLKKAIGNHSIKPYLIVYDNKLFNKKKQKTKNKK